MELAGATQIVRIGKADASNQQLQSIDEWIENLWEPLKKAVESAPSITEEELKELQIDTLKICEDSIPNFINSLRKSKPNSMLVNLLVMPFLVALFAVLAYIFLQSKIFVMT